MTNDEIFQSILINASKTDSRSLIMPHQQEAVNEMTKYFKIENDIENRNGIVVMPTGSGKTYTAVNWLLSQGVANGYRVVWLVHRQELVEQTYREFCKQAPILKDSDVKRIRILPISSAHLRMVNAYKADVYVCSIASVANQYGYRFIERMIGAAGKRKLIIVVDEAHHATAANYQKVIKRMTKLNPNRILLGLTATPTRMQESEQRKLQHMFNINQNLVNRIGHHGYVYEVTLKQLLLSGFLAKPIYERVNTEIIGEIEYDVSDEDEKYFMQFGELSEKLKYNIANSSARNKAIVDQYLKNKKKYGKTLIFAVNQLHAETLAKEFKGAGVSCDYAISGRKDAQDVIRRFKSNDFDVLINVQILTEGSDVPTIQTVFLTRQTNSDSLLMQMIGRGLRGEKAGGTKEAYIVAFHDTWETFARWLDPGELDIFEAPDSNEEEAELLPVIEPKNEEDSLEVNPILSMENVISDRDIYLKLYELMRVSLVNKNEALTLPCGWYAVIDEEGDNYSILVFEEQISNYKNIESNVKRIANRLTVEDVKNLYFNDEHRIPEDRELDYLLEYINETNEMPQYYTFEMRESLDPSNIKKYIDEHFNKEAEKEQWLKDFYDKNEILQLIYKYFYAFKKTVFDVDKEYKSEYIARIENERQKYNLIENYFDLDALLNEVLDMYPKLTTEGLVKLSWSNYIELAWFGLCEYIEVDDKKKYQIYINKLLSSPNVDKEVIKYLIFHELLHQNGYWNHDMDFREREWQYPNSAELDGFLDNISLEYDMSEYWNRKKQDEKNNFSNKIEFEQIRDKKGTEEIEEKKSISM